MFSQIGGRGYSYYQCGKGGGPPPPSLARISLGSSSRNLPLESAGAGAAWRAGAFWKR